MNERDFIKKIKNLDLGIITLSDAAHIINKDKKYTAIYMKRLEERDVIQRVEKGKYILPETDLTVISTNLVHPAYISFLSGLSYYHKTSQIPIITQVVTTVSKKSINYKKNKIIFIKLNQKRIFGYKKEKTQNGYAFIGELEKIILDSLFIPKRCPLIEVKNALEIKNIQIEKILSYALKMDSIVTLKRLGYLLELNGVDIHDRINNHLNKRYDLLNPVLPLKGKNNKKWMLKINEVL